MFGMKKKRSDDSRGLPDLPSDFKLSAKPELVVPRQLIPKSIENEGIEEKHSLPAFPDEKIHKGFANSAIKEAVKDTAPEPDEDELDNLGKEIDLSPPEDIENMSPMPLPNEDLREIPPPKLAIQDYSAKYKPLKQREGSEIFVKIDKYRSARRSLQYAQDMLEEIDDLLRKIKETRMREEQELSSWEKQVKEAKTQIENVREGIFEKAK